ncbi:EVE domain-containing protein [Methylobacterium phyllosphaerae]
MRTWIFQGNPDLFDIDAYLAAWPPEFPWLVTRYAREIAVGDQVFIWKTGGAARGVSGIVAEAIVTAETEEREGLPSAKSLWRGEATAVEEKRSRALLKPVRVATSREVLRREWLGEDAVLRDMHIIRMASGTNFPVTPTEAARLNLMWSRIGQNWTRDESLAGLWAYVKTLGTSVSRLPGSPVAEVSDLTGRPVAGVYNKVMNFRALDPRDQRAGLSGTGAHDVALWSEFYDTDSGTLRTAEIDVEFQRVWRPRVQATSSAVTAETLEEAARLLEREDLSGLLDRYTRGLSVRPIRPAVIQAQTRGFERDPLAVAITRKRAQFQCEVPSCSHPTFTTADGLPYCEVHHIIPLSEGGQDTIENMACICPAHHREAHWGLNKAAIEAALLEVRTADGGRAP